VLVPAALVCQPFAVCCRTVWRIDGADLLVADVTAANGFLHVVSDVLTGT
jgi:hypothetical protein